MRKQDEGIIVRVTPVKDSDAIVTILARKAGELGLYCKGVLSSKSKRKNQFQALNIVSFSYKQGNQENSGFLSTSDLIASPTGLHNESHFYSEIFILAEALAGFQDNYRELFSLIEQLVKYKDPADSLKLCNYALLKLMQISGFINDLSMSVKDGNKLDPNQAIQLSYDHPGYIQASGNESDIGTRQIKLQNLALRSDKPENYLKISTSKSEQLTLLRTHILWLEMLLDKELKSKHLVNSIK